MKLGAAATTVNILAPNEVEKQEFRLIESAVLGKGGGVASPPRYTKRNFGETRENCFAGLLVTLHAYTSCVRCAT